MSYMTKDQLESYLNGLPKNTSKKDYNQVKNELVYPMAKLSVSQDNATVEDQELGSIKDRVNRLSTATGTSFNTKDVMTPAFPKTPTPQVTKPTFAYQGDAFEASLAPRQKIRRPVVAPKSTPPLPPLPIFSPPPAIPDSPRPPRRDKVSTLNPLYAGIDCPGCQKPIEGTVVSAMDQVWHASCFVCAACHTGLESEEYFVHEGQPFCANDYRSMFSLRCDYCQQPITQTAIRALGKHYHEGHFCCVVCRVPFDDHSAFMVHEGQPYCQQDYMKTCGKKCSGCGDYIAGEYIHALDRPWHKKCFVCTECKQPFTGGSFIIRDDKPYCEKHTTTTSDKRPQIDKKPQTDKRPPAIKPKPVFGKPDEPSPTHTTFQDKPKSGKQCHHCGEVIDGPCATALGHDYHVHHFQCSQCQRTLSSRVPGMWTGDQQNELVCKLCANKKIK